jgi:oxygen-independent coproporphyrinogen III oxidase
MNASSNKTAEAVYVHVPFCSRKCPYCAFSCKDGYAFDEVALYLRTLGAEAAFRTGSSRPSVRTLYFGGGTPSALGVRGLRSLYATLRSAFDLRGMIEHTVELNPEHVDRPLSEAVASEGCRRASLGVQSFSPFHLKRLGRDHEAGDVVVSFEALRKADVRSVNVDLMYGLPLQSVSDFLDDLKKALDLGADHVSLYQLEFDDSTPFGFARSRGRMAPADDGAAAEMFHGARETASRYGLEWYETSNFAREGHQSVHNRVYWANAPYLGLGPGAYGRIGALRYRNHAETTAWSRALDEGKAPHAEEDFLD